MPFDFAMYLLKADECCGDDADADDCQASLSDINNNDKRLLTSQPITYIPSKTFPKTFTMKNSPVNVFSFSQAHIFTEELSSLKRDLESLKMELHKNKPEKDQTQQQNVVCNMKQFNKNGIHCYNGIISDNRSGSRKSLQNQSGPFTTMLRDLTNTFEADHDDATCHIPHCHLCKGPKRALSIDSARMRPKVRRKVTFADDNGMPLTKVRVMPNSTGDGRTSPITSLDIYGVHGRYKQLCLDFPQPAADFNTFLERLRAQNVSLENVKTDGTSFLGTVRVKNLAMEKDVRMRFTTDNWLTWTDIVASYVFEDATSCYDLFGFLVSVGHLPNEVEFAICYRVRDEEHWDNNNGKNYKLKLISR